jgi:hypothetical protein
MSMTMRIAIVSVIVGFLFVATSGFTNPPGSREDIDNVAGKEWLVRYDATETVKNMFKRAERKPEQQAIRLRVKKEKTGGKTTYSARLWRFKAKGGGGYQLVDKTDNPSNDWIALTFEDHGNGRHRMGFKAKCPLYDPTDTLTTNTVSINGVWQPGFNLDNRDSDRVQLKLYITSTRGFAPTSGSDCDEDPDTDVLEESTAPTGDDTPPAP